ncbi:uncharacterized protein LOC141632447 [Silene latifolia]|uniref:uncharacterized protein LOC141632447 n=1 Tax=Silene latifolia TaxID=37657 RepID=UPI003D77105C
MWALQKLVGEDKGRFLALIWALWTIRNARLFEEEPCNLEVVVMGFTRLVADYQGYVNAGLVRESSGEGESTGLNLWKPPEQGTIKFNSDAAFLGEMDVGLGVVGRNSRGEVVVVASKRCRAQWSVETAEAKAMMFGLEVAKHLGVNNIALESDSMVAVRAVKKNADMRHSFGLCVRDVCELIKSFVCRGVNHVKREGNTVAHLVARLCSAIGEELICVSDFPHSVLSLAELDLI